MPYSIVLTEISPCYCAATAWGTEKQGAGGGAPPDQHGRENSRPLCRGLGWFLLKCDVKVVHGDQPVSGLQENSIFREERAADNSTGTCPFSGKDWDHPKQTPSLPTLGSDLKYPLAESQDANAVEN